MAKKPKRGRPPLPASERTIKMQFRLSKSVASEFKRLCGKERTRAGICRLLIEQWVMARRKHEHRKAVAARAKKGSRIEIGDRELGLLPGSGWGTAKKKTRR